MPDALPLIEDFTEEQIAVCQLPHPGWADGFEYRHLPARRFTMAAPTPGKPINHETQQLGDRQIIAAGTTLLWVGSAHQMHYSGSLWLSYHVVQAAAGPLAGQCFEISSDEPGLLASMQLLGQDQ